MHRTTTLIYTDNLSAVRDFYQSHFLQFPNALEMHDSFTLSPNSEGMICWLDAAVYHQPKTSGVTLRIHVPYTEIERAQFIERGLTCSTLHEESWGEFHGNTRWFSMTDPSGVVVVIYEDHYGEGKQLMTTGDGRNTKEATLSDVLG